MEIISHCSIIAKECQISLKQVEKTVELLNEGATIPFLARYRKEQTGSLDEVVLLQIRDRYVQLDELDKRRAAILASLIEQGKLSEDLKNKLALAQNKTELEDLYLPYKPKRKTRGSMAIAKGLEPLAKQLMQQNTVELETLAQRYVDKQKELETIDDVLAGARDIIAEWISESAAARARLRNLYGRTAQLSAKKVKPAKPKEQSKEINLGERSGIKEEDAQKYKNYFEWSECLLKAPSHRLLAMFRGETEGFLKLKIEVQEEEAIAILKSLFVKGTNASSAQVQLALTDAYKRLLSAAMETEMRNLAKERADKAAIIVFAENLRQLLLASPLGQKNVLAIDPGFRTGCKLVCLDKQGNLVHNETIYPHPPVQNSKAAAAKVMQLIEVYKIEAIAIGNGTAGRETEDFIKKLQFKKEIVAVMVSENGASIYSASPVAREEFPDYDITVRGAVSIGRRLMDPLAELVKIEPKSIGVGQYQHDVNATLLQNSLEDTVVSCVNKVGVELNTASKQLLSYVSGVGETLAKNIITYRKENGAFQTREELKKVPRFGPKAYEQAAGFLRIAHAKNPLDTSAVHPESYAVVEKMAKSLKCSVTELIEKKSLRAQIKCLDFVDAKTG
ncbi:MAG: Tex-like N-terminal domain-containing protein, partial [Bacteroidales bacterium]